jgi:SHS2 domain-containing protein
VTNRYSIVSHTADTGIETTANTLGDAIGNAAFAMFDLMYDLSSIPAETAIAFTTVAASPEDLLVEVLSGLLLRSELGDVVFSRIAVRESRMRATVEASGSTTVGRDLRGPPIKAVTYHELRCESIAGGWMVRVIFDV